MPCLPPDPPILLFGDEFDHYEEDVAKIKQKVNVTKMKDYHTGSCGQWVSVYPTIEDPSSQPDCSPYSSLSFPIYVCGNLDDGCTNDSIFCTKDVDNSYFQPTPAGSGSFTVYTLAGGAFTNNYSQSLTTGSAPCRLLGFKNVYANKLWQGRKSYCSRDLMKADSWDWCCLCGFHDYDPTPDNTKYLTVTGESTLTYASDNYDVVIGTTPIACCCLVGVECCPSCGCTGGDTNCECSTGYCITKTYTGTTTVSAFGNATGHVDIYGNTSGTCSSGSSGGCSSGTPDDQYQCRKGLAEDGFSGVGIADADYTNIGFKWCSYIESFSFGGNPPDVVTGDEATGTWHLEWHTTVNDYDGCGCVTATHNYILYSMDISEFHFEVHTYGIKNILLSSCPCDPFVPDWIELSHETIDWSCTGVSSEQYGFNPSWSNAFIGTRNSGGSLSDTYTANQVYSDVVNLLSQWDMGNDKIYPWRNSSTKTKGPLVTRDETSAIPSTALCAPSTNTYTGRILGAPAPEGIDHVWNPSAKNYCVCDSLVQPGCFDFYPQTDGQWSDAGCEVPRATQWLNTFQSNNVPDGAFVMSNQFYTFPSTCNSNGPARIFDDAVWACKYAEVIPPIQAYNWFRPCAADRFQITSSGTNCLISFSASVATIDTGFGGLTPNIINNFSPVAIMGTGLEDGIYQVASIGADTVTVGNCMMSASDFPYDPFFEDGTGWIGNLRWNSVHNLCGSQSIQSVDISASVATINFTDPQWLISGDQIIVDKCQGLTGINNSVFTVYMINNQNYRLVGSVVSGSYQGSGYAYSPFAPALTWNSVAPQMEFVSKKWSYNFHDVGEYYRVSGSIVFVGGESGCDGVTPCYTPGFPPNPRTNQCGIDQTVTEMKCETIKLGQQFCRPNVVYYSPNATSESFAAGSKNAGWYRNGPDGPPCDSIYGTLWQAIPQRNMNDPLAPFVPCLCQADVDPDTSETHYDCTICQYVQDDGTCQADEPGDPDFGIPCVHYYPHVDQFEARCAAPEGAPSLPPEAVIGCATTPPAACAGHAICTAPLAPQSFSEEESCNPYEVFVFEDPWILLQLEEACVCANGRFADNYARNGVQCQG